VYPVVRNLFAPLFAEGPEVMTISDSKTQLQETVQARWKITPTYHLIGTRGPDHAREFEIEVRMSGKPLAIALGASKKEAEQAAARAAMREVE
ncbi:putative dsRNA-binding protein, partial [Bdellovibrionota bacterium FG-2]